ncbi:MULTISPECIES: SIR2 family NAD-dependent protein deacylase [Ramlibacter]|uniref:NAD-dependent protein deacylase n=1 Tax=Ramlibacter pinisoli TaxID=2682844 RepID=A0A6N8IPR8_9BURK|nr:MULTISPECIES: NAD-dependent deacylase [Ramlibacter]MBA2963178.1 NAD-dependent deacylase [Ramlibacter sp. CGMCC 1.13660]MVQ28146.1 NAD-dependent protein deacylase [Ramlibacter pinisoli]
MSLADVREWVRGATSIAVLTGAGVSQESGVPTFRDAQTGLWARFRPEDLATEQAFRADPGMVWDWYVMRRAMVARVEPNAGHRALARFQQARPGRLALITQNVDGLHQRAGSTGVLALHGTLQDDRWLDRPRPCCTALPPQEGRPPRCGRCGNLRRPAVVWFGELLPAEVLAAAEQAARSCDLMLVAGTSGVVYPAAGLARTAAERARMVVVNPGPSDLDDAAHAVLRGTSATLLPQLLEDGA